MIDRKNVDSIPLVASCLLFALVISVYSFGINGPFQYDDIHSIKDNPNIRKISNIPIFFQRADMFTIDERSSMFRPLVLVTYALNYYIDGLRVNGYHWLNICIHSMNSVLLLSLGRRIGLGLPAAIFSAFFFAFHPVNSEAINYISSRSESLCAFYMLCALLFYLVLRSRASFSLALYIASVICFGLSLLCKSVGLMLIPVLLFYEWTFFVRQGVRSSCKLLVPFYAVGICYVFKVRSMLETSLFTAPVRSIDVQLTTQLKAMIQYIEWLFFPWPLSVEPGFTLGTSFTLYLLCVVMLISLTRLWWTSNSITHFCFGWALFSILPTIVVPLNVLVNEHRLYVVTMAFSIALFSILQQTQRKISRKLFVSGIIMMIIFACLDVTRTKEWADPRTLWQSAQQEGPQMPRPYIFLGDINRHEGHHELAIKNYARALVVQKNILSGGDLFSIYSGIGGANLAQGEWSQAEQSYLAALQVDPKSESTQLALDGIYAFRTNVQRNQAKDLLREGLIALVSGQVETAINLLKKSVTIMPDARNLQALAKAYERVEQWEEADMVYQRMRIYENEYSTNGNAPEKSF
ncbi:MAG: hypothetical protein VX294_02640 [Candidatus Latescibacterota bacterium]|nr:hypothetical protein [Candidatus Latescibacterota bacterium]